MVIFKGYESAIFWIFAFGNGRGTSCPVSLGAAQNTKCLNYLTIMD